MHPRYFSLLLASILLLSLPPVFAEEPGKTLKLVTYNVLASPDHWKERVPALLEILKASDADIIALQEVAPEFANALVSQEWAKRYHFPLKDGKPFVAYEYLILSKYPVETYTLQPLPGPQRRHLFVAQLRVEGRSVAVATCHLESLLEDGPIRARQLDAYFKELKGADDAFFLGDFNFGDGELPDTKHLDPDFKDAWLEVNQGLQGFTWNIETSAMARDGSFPKETSRRLDRILVRSTKWKPKSAKILGDTPISEITPSVFPSDHFGLEAVFVSGEDKNH